MVEKFELFLLKIQSYENVTKTQKHLTSPQMSSHESSQLYLKCFKDLIWRKYLPDSSRHIVCEH